MGRSSRFLVLTCVGPLCTAAIIAQTAMAQTALVAPAPVHDPRPFKLCRANALQLAHCAQAWERLVLNGGPATGIDDTWNAAEFEGIVDGFFNSLPGSSATSSRKWCPRILESRDQLDRVIAADLIAHSTQLTVDDAFSVYLTNAAARLWPCPPGGK